MPSVGRVRLPASALPMAGGLLMVGVGGFGFLVVVGHTTSVTAKAALSALYLIGNVAGPGLFAGLEQETSRVVSSGLAAGVDVRAGLRRAATVGVGLAAVAIVVLLALAPLLVPRSFAGHAGLLLWLLLGVVGSAEVFLVRGILGGARRFGGYAVTLAVEGLARLLPCLAVAALGVTNVNVYGLIFAGATGLAAAAAFPWLRSTRQVLAAAPATAPAGAGVHATAAPATAPAGAAGAGAGAGADVAAAVPATAPAAAGAQATVAAATAPAGAAGAGVHVAAAASDSAGAPAPADAGVRDGFGGRGGIRAGRGVGAGLGGDDGVGGSVELGAGRDVGAGRGVGAGFGGDDGVGGSVEVGADVGRGGGRGVGEPVAGSERAAAGALAEGAETDVVAGGATAAAERVEAVVAGHGLRRVARGVGLLGVATLLAQLVANLAPLVVTGRMLGSRSDELAAVAFGFAFVLTRAPLLLFSPVQALLLPRLTAAVVRGELHVVRAQVRLGLGAVAVVGLGGVAAAGIAGPWAVQTLFGSEQRPSTLVMVLLGVSTGLLMVVQLLQPVLVAVGRHRTASVAWIVGTAVLVGLLVLPGPPVTAAVVAQLTAAAVVALVSTLGLLDILRPAPAASGQAAVSPSLVLTECVPAATERALEPR